MDWRPLQASADGRGLGKDSNPCSSTVCQGHMGASDTQAATQEAERTVANPFSFFYNAKEIYI